MPRKKVGSQKSSLTKGYGGMKAKVPTPAHTYGAPASGYKLRLYVAGRKITSLAAISDLQNFCHDFLRDKVEFDVVDLYKHPELAMEDQVLAVPCLVKLRPLPRAYFVGEMKDCRRILIRLGIDPEKL